MARNEFERTNEQTIKALGIRKPMFFLTHKNYANEIPSEVECVEENYTTNR